MKLKIKINKFPINLWLPTGFLKYKLFQKLFHIEEYGEIMVVLLKEVKNYIKTNGHFTLVDIEAYDDETPVNIKIKLQKSIEKYSSFFKQKIRKITSIL